MATLSIFASGVAVGVVAAKLRAQRSKPPELAAAEILPIRGIGFEPAGASASTMSEQRAPPPSPTHPESSRTVAETALTVTAAITGNGVYGAGIVIHPHHVLTCLHVVDEMKSISVSIADGEPERATIVDRDARLDLAVLRVERPRTAHARLTSASSLRMGDRAFAMGAPRKMSFSLSGGFVSYVGRPYSDLYYLQTDIAANSGSSGGPVLDAQGRVAGIASFILRGSHGLAFALPVDYAYRRFSQYFADRMELRAFDAWLAERKPRSAKATQGQRSAPR